MLHRTSKERAFIPRSSNLLFYIKLCQIWEEPDQQDVAKEFRINWKRVAVTSMFGFGFGFVGPCRCSGTYQKNTPEDGPTHQPIEHLANFKAMPNILMLRPADGTETAGAYKVEVLNRNKIIEGVEKGGNTISDKSSGNCCQGC
ncbi:hypothetical protein NE237_032156 [Protea cynaroides]|uniref:Transketolase-like pyrimidine-binding domain-containing protein n=1 Tax=Protea cynaroides TaxID=273540 RepID=A0A9Q0L2T3_9MAGN|nr:hypothetical protein NE237_032156 [Protea cynaroides]